MAIEGSKKSQSSISQPPRKINVQKFAESRATELESLHSAISTRLNNDFRSRRNKRRRTTAFDNQVANKRNRKRRRLTRGDKSNILGSETDRKNKSSLPRCVRRRLELKKNPDSGFVTSGDGTKRLRTHVWHAKRFTMTKRWGFYLPLGLQGRGRGSRAVLKWFKQGVMVHDASYNAAVQLEGPEGTLMEILQMVLVPSPPVQSEGFSDSVLSGIAYGTGMLHHVELPFSQPIAPVAYMWCPRELSKEDCKNNCLDVVDCNEPCTVENHSCFRQLWLWIHASAFSEAFDAMKCACQKLMIERGIAINCFSREGQLAKLELLGSKAFQLLQKTVHPVTCILEKCWQPQKCSVAENNDDFQKKETFELENEEHVPSCAVLSVTMRDPRLVPGKRSIDVSESDSILDMQETEASEHHNLTGNLGKNEKVFSPSCSKTEGKGNLSYNKNLWDASSRIEPPEEENELCIEKHQQQMRFFCLNDPKSRTQKNLNKVQHSRSFPVLLLKDDNKKNSPMGWSIILPISWAKVFWLYLVSSGAHAIGLREKHWIAYEIGLPYFPSDFPDCNAYSSLKEIEATASLQNAELRSPAIRPFRIPIPPPWNVVHTAFDKISMRVKNAEISSGENIIEKNSMINSSYGGSNVASFRCHNSFDGIVARTSSVLTDYLKGIHGEHLFLFPQIQNSKSSFVKVVKDKSMTEKCQNQSAEIYHSRKLCFVRIHLHAYKEGVFEDGAVVCAPCLTDISLWTSSAGSIEGGLEMPNSAVGSYFKEQSSGKWELQVLEDPASSKYHRWPVGFVTTGFVRGSKKPTAAAFCDAVCLACLRELQWKDMPVNSRRKEIYVLVRNLRSSAYRLALATIVLEQQEEDVRFL